MKYYQYGKFCLLDGGGRIPREAVPVAQPFAPLVIAVERDGQTSRGLWRIASLSELNQQEDPQLLTALPPAREDPLEAFVRAHGASVLNTAFAHAYDQLKVVSEPRTTGFTVHLVGLGDVGGTVLTGLKLLGRELEKIGIYDPNDAQCRRYCLEMNQILPEQEGGHTPEVERVGLDELFQCDCLLFTASLGVPPVGSGVEDVRMAQFVRNRQMLRQYAKMAREQGFSGLFCQISDPVDHLSRVVFLESNRDEQGRFDGKGLLPEQVQGYGLGVMRGRAAFYAKELGIDFSSGEVFGPHGKELIAANAVGEGYDPTASLALTHAAATANQRVRELGFKPYLAPGLSSAAISVLRTLRGQWHDGAVPLGGAYFGCQSRMTRQGLELRRRAIHPLLLRRLQQVHKGLREFDYDG